VLFLGSFVVRSSCVQRNHAFTRGVRRMIRHGGAKATAKVFVSSAPRATAAGGSQKRAAAALRCAASGSAAARAQMKTTLGDSFVSST